MPNPLPTGFYGRLFAPRFPADPATTEAGLIALARTMQADPLNPPPAENDDLSFLAPAGYTYLGQFIDHDLSHDVSTVDGASGSPAMTPNFQTARLDLDHLYGGDPSLSPQLYRPDVDPREARFLLGRTTPGGLLRDLPRMDGAPFEADPPRHMENLLLSQITVAFLRFHNRVMDLASQPGFPGPLPPGDTLFQRVRRLVTWHYQWIVRNDFLYNVINKEVWKRLAAGQNLPFLPAAGQPMPLPVEFNVGAFRYGHSTVRNSYQVNNRLPRVATRDHDTLLEDLLNPRRFLADRGPLETPDWPGEGRVLHDDWVVDWRFFFRYLPGSFPSDTLTTAKMDTYLSDALHALPADFLPGTDTFRPALAERTLLRGSRVGLPSGQDVVGALATLPIVTQEMGLRKLTDGELRGNPAAAAVLEQYSFVEHTPLWYYLLREAEVLGKRRRLGPAGSLLVGGIIFAALHADQDSFVNAAGPGWKPTLGTGQRFTFSDLLVWAGVHHPSLA